MRLTSRMSIQEYDAMPREYRNLRKEYNFVIPELPLKLAQVKAYDLAWKRYLQLYPGIEEFAIKKPVTFD